MGEHSLVGPVKEKGTRRRSRAGQLLAGVPGRDQVRAGGAGPGRAWAQCRCRDRHVGLCGACSPDLYRLLIRKEAHPLTQQVRGGGLRMGEGTGGGKFP